MEELEKKFANVPVDDDGKSVVQGYVKVGSIIARHEIWTWDGITGSSLIFDEKDLSGISDDELQKTVQKSTQHKGESTVSRNRSGFAFVNFDFDTGD